MVASSELLDALGARVGDSVRAGTGMDTQLRGMAGERMLAIVGRARFVYTSAGQRAASLPLETLQLMGGDARTDRISAAMVRVRSGADVESVRGAIERAAPSVTAVSIDDAVKQVDQRLSYFRQLAFILGSVSLFVGFLLVTTIVTVTVNERTGQIAVLRAIGVTRLRLVARVAMEGVLLMLVGGALGMGLGLLTARYLEGILGSFPGLPAAIRFFLFQPQDAWRAMGMLAAAGVLAGLYPAWRAASLPIASTLREEAVG
jgi:putative ABC transport system permease protein